MLDFRHETFYELCRIKSYTKTAEILHITQPAVSQHIRYLENVYGGPLFVYNAKTLALTGRGERLYRYVQVMRADNKKITEELRGHSAEEAAVQFGATLTIGEYVMPAVLSRIIADDAQYKICMRVGNTQTLLQELSNGNIEFALLEGYYDKSLYSAKRLSREKFAAVCAPSSPLAGCTVPFEQVAEQRLILREEGSGTREVFESELRNHNLSLGSFGRICEIGNLNAIKELVKNGTGISFMYAQAAKKELEQGELAEFAIEGFSAAHEFDFVFLKNSVYQQRHMEWFGRIRAAYTPVGGAQAE